MAFINSPLRYPGGKSSLSRHLAKLIKQNDINDCIYIEPFAGGAGAGINLLLSGIVSRLCLNDADSMIYAFWTACLVNTDVFLKLVMETPINMNEWERQRKILNNSSEYSILEKGFAAFYMNRTNRSGILDGGPIGGKNQNGKWKIDARFNRKDLCRRISNIAKKANKIEIHGLDAMSFLKHILPTLGRNTFLFHLKKINSKWVMTYDDDPNIRSIYNWCNIKEFNLNYFASKASRGCELFISPRHINLPDNEVTIHYNQL